MVGKTLAGRYELLEMIGEGGMARVYRGRDHLLRRTVAVKILKDQMTGDADFVRRFRREAQAAAGLSHPNIVNIYDVGERGNTYFMVMEYVDGKNLKQHIREKGRLTAYEAVSITRQIAEALAQAHAAGVVHRDIKPQNIIFSRDGQVKVADFGIAIAADGTTITCGDDIVGSVHYFSPEQARGNVVGKQSDLYSLGIILYEMVTGQVPFTGDSPVSIAMKHVEEPVPSPRKLAEDIPEALERVILKAVQKDPSRRYTDAPELLDDLMMFQNRGTVGVDVNSFESEDEDTRVMKPVSAKKSGGFREFVRKPWFVLLVIVLFLSVALLVGFVTFRDYLIIPDVTVPDVRGLSQPDAVRILEDEGLQVNPSVQHVNDDTIQSGYVVRTEPFQGRVVKKNRVIDLYVSLGPEAVLVPDLISKTEAEARILLSQSDLKVTVTRENKDGFAENVVFNQIPEGGTSLSRGEEVHIFVSLGSRAFFIDNLIDRSREYALAYLEDKGLISRLSYRPSSKPAGTVVDQLPAPGSSVRPGSTIDLVISTGSENGNDDDEGDDD